jgi:hypothetical protein
MMCVIRDASRDLGDFVDSLIEDAIARGLSDRIDKLRSACCGYVRGDRATNECSAKTFKRGIALPDCPGRMVWKREMPINIGMYARKPARP